MRQIRKRSTVRNSKLSGWVLIVVMALVAAACGTDDGGEVRNIDESSGSPSGSASASGSASGAGSGSASGSASGIEGGVTGQLGGYTPGSDVSAHARVVLDICEINDLLPSEAAIDYDAIRTLYEAGKNSVNGDGSVRTLGGFARSERDEAIWNDYVDHYGDPTWLDTFVTDAIDGTGPFAGQSDPVRRQGIQKGIQNQIMVSWVLHELAAALDKAEAGEYDPADGAPHNWDEAWAFYHGEAPDCAPYSTADKRGENFGTGTAVNDALEGAFIRGLEALVAEDPDVAVEAKDEILRQITITHIQATIRYANQIESALADGDVESARIAQAEGWGFFRVIEPLVADVDPAAADVIAGTFDLSAGDPQAGSAEAVESAIQSTYEALRITAEEVGELTG
jgi:hypothetical protein